MLLLIAMLLFKLPDVITLSPSGLLLTVADGRIYCYDGLDERLWYINEAGELAAETKVKKGWGPGELQSIAGAASFQDTFYIADRNRQKLLVFSGALKFIKEFTYQGIAREIFVAKDGIFLQMFDPVHQTMITRFDFQFQFIKTFGTPIQTKLHQRFMDGFQVGQMFPIGERLFFVHILQPYIYEYSLDGVQLHRVPLPGFQETSIWAEDPGEPLPKILNKVYSTLETPTQIRIFITASDASRIDEGQSFLFDTVTGLLSKPLAPPKGRLLGDRYYKNQVEDTRNRWIAVGEVFQ